MTKPDNSWTPVWADLIERYGPMEALVYGRVWRYCQGEHQACVASHATIAKELGISRRTVVRHLKTLVKGGHLKAVRWEYNKPNTLVVTESHRVCDKKSQPVVTKSHSKIEKKIQKKKQEQLGDIFSHYENEIGLLTPLVSDKVQAWVDDYSEPWVKSAIDAAVLAGVRKPNYINAILKNWKANGRKDDKKEPAKIPEIL